MYELNLSLEDSHTSTLTLTHDNVLLDENTHKWGLSVPLPPQGSFNRPFAAASVCLPQFDST